MDTVVLTQEQRIVVDYVRSRVREASDNHQRWCQELTQLLTRIASELSLDISQSWDYQDGTFISKKTE